MLSFALLLLMMSALASHGLRQQIFRKSSRLFSSNGGVAPIATFLLEYKYVENMGDKRGPHREGHLALAQKLMDSSNMIAAGPFTPQLDGAMFIFKGEKSKIEEFVKEDPYNVAGLVTSYSIRDWTVVVGRENIGI
jgi:uncharacterized protein YciI